MIGSPNRVEIDLFALQYNLRQIRKLIDRDIKVMAVVKSDAYGHGLLRVSRVLEKNGVDCLGVAHLHEALELREDGRGLPIIILCGIRSREDAGEVVDKALTPVLSDLTAAEILAEESYKKGKLTNIHLKVDTGMGRLGISPEEAGEFMRRVMRQKGLYLEALTSHLSSADEPVADFTENQIKKFKKIIEMGRAMGLELSMNNLANSAGIMAHKVSHLNMVRPGIMLYGGLPSPDFHCPLPLKPVMHFKGRILQIRDFPDHTPVSYGRKYHTKGPQKIAVLSAGYGDGILRSMSNRGKVLVRGKRVNIVGRVCMNMIMADVTGLKDTRIGDEAVFLGVQGDETITGDDMAGWSDSISYEIFCSIGRKGNRKYIS